MGDGRPGLRRLADLGDHHAVTAVYGVPMLPTLAMLADGIYIGTGVIVVILIIVVIVLVLRR